MPQDKTMKKPTSSSKRVSRSVRFVVKGPHGVVNLRELLESYPPGTKVKIGGEQFEISKTANSPINKKPI